MLGPLNLSRAPRIDLSEAKARFDRNGAVFVDLRSRKDYDECHIPGAISIPIREILRHLGQLPRDRLIIFY